MGAAVSIDRLIGTSAGPEMDVLFKFTLVVDKASWHGGKEPCLNNLRKTADYSSNLLGISLNRPTLLQDQPYQIGSLCICLTILNEPAHGIMVLIT